MNAAMLNSLLLDRALGELSPEVTALLEAYLAQHPEDARRAAEFSATMDLSRAAVAVPTAAPRPFDVTRLQPRPPAAAQSSRRSEMLRLAACVAVGLGLGWLARPAPMAVTSPSAVVPARAPDPATHFWSVARFAPNSTALSAQKNR
jgi:anti-sigma factor RsiW